MIIYEVFKDTLNNDFYCLSTEDGYFSYPYFSQIKTFCFNNGYNINRKLKLTEVEK